MEEANAGAGMQENLVFSNLAKDQRDMNMEAYRHTRQTILCSATIPQRYIVLNALILCLSMY